MYYLGTILESGKVIPKNIKEALKYYKMAADLGVSYGMYCYASMQENSLENCDDNQGVSQDLEEVVKYYKMAVDAGHFGAMINYGLLFEIGKGVQKDVKEANEIVEISSEEF